VGDKLYLSKFIAQIQNSISIGHFQNNGYLYFRQELLEAARRNGPILAQLYAPGLLS
jgi:hypothetical protein